MLYRHAGTQTPPATLKHRETHTSSTTHAHSDSFRKQGGAKIALKYPSPLHRLVLSIRAHNKMADKRNWGFCLTGKSLSTA